MSAKKLIPLLDRVLIQKVVAPSKSVGGVLLPESAAQKVWYTSCRSSIRFVTQQGPYQARLL